MRADTQTDRHTDTMVAIPPGSGAKYYNIKVQFPAGPLSRNIGQLSDF